MRKILLLACILISDIYCVSDTNINIENCALYRTQKYPLKNNKKIHLITPPRTGSTFVFNVLRFLFEEDDVISKKVVLYLARPDQNVIKNHSFKRWNENTELIVSTIRNPIDSCFSLVVFLQNRKGLKISQNNHLTSEIKRLVKHTMNIWEQLGIISETYPISFLKYEDFNDNLGRLFNILEKNMAINIHTKDKFLIEQNFSKASVKKYLKENETKKQNKELVELTGFSHTHVEGYNYLSPMEIYAIKKSIKNELFLYRALIEHMGYDWIFNEK